ncbi:MAG: DUF5979 domain-containing protein [Lachnospiraceae bacterium]|nr:DUF5979 domain-containing protein [Lachnospiraceae bacterium]
MMKMNMVHVRFLFLSVLMLALLFTGASATADNSHITFTNVQTSQPDLFITKTVTSAVSGYEIPDVEFTFVLKWDLDQDGKLTYAKNEMYYVYSADGSQILNYDKDGNEISWKTTSAGRFTLKAGQTAKFEYAGADVEYEVTEIWAGDNWQQVTPAEGLSATGRVDKEGTTVYFENLYVPEVPTTDTGGEEPTTLLSVRKAAVDINGNTADTGETFTFTILIGNVAYAGKTYTIYDSDGNVSGSGTTDSDGSFSISGGERAVFDDIPLYEDYSVTEAAKDGWNCLTGATAEGGTSYPVTYLSFTNQRQGGYISLTKVDGTNETVTLPDAVFGVYSDEGCETLISTLTTGSDGAVTSEKLPAGDYYIKEMEAPDGYTLDEDTVYQVTVEDEKTVLVNGTGIVTNAPDAGSIRLIKKDASGNLLAEVTFEMTCPDGATLEQSTGDEGEVLFDGLIPGTYTVTETKTVSGQMLLTESFDVTIPLAMTEEEVAEQDDIDTSSAVVRNSTYYFYNLTYEITNSAAFSMPVSGSIGFPWQYIVSGLTLFLAAFVVLQERRKKA